MAHEVHLRSLARQFEEDPNAPGRIDIVTDRPNIDLGLIHPTNTWDMPILNFGKPGEQGVRLWHVDPSGRLEALNARDDCDLWMKKNAPGVVHDHCPENDAEHTYYQMVYLNRKDKDLDDDV
jgi:hypothetical protein